LAAGANTAGLMNLYGSISAPTATSSFPTTGGR
jgi:hypothetical protein